MSRVCIGFGVPSAPMVMNVESGSLSPTLIVIVEILSRGWTWGLAGKAGAELMRLWGPSQVVPRGQLGRRTNWASDAPAGCRQSRPQRALLIAPARVHHRSSRPHRHPSGHGPAGLASPRLADERQAQGFALKLVSIARAGEVDLKVDEVVADVGFEASLPGAA